MNEQIDSKRPQVLIVDDTPDNLKILWDVLEPEGYKILAASDGKEALRIAEGTLPDIILLDIMMPEMDGYEVCRRLKENETTKLIPVIFITVRDEKESVIEAFRAGGVDYIIKPFENEEVLLRVKTHLEINRLTQALSEKNRDLEQRTEDLTLANRRLQEANQRLEQEIARRKQAEEDKQKADEQLSVISQQEAQRWGIEGFVGKSQTIRKILADVRSLQSTETTSVLITGESGTGKELIARAIHFGGTRAKGPFIPLNCSTIPGELAESTLFGHLRGAFTGANTSRKGYFELASGGTLFLDEIGDMPLELQPKLLRVIEDGCIMPVGAVKEKHVDVRIIAATNQNLREKIAQKSFREDLYFRLEGFTVTVPPLRERKEDIPLLVHHFLTMFATEMGIEGPEISPEALSALEAYHFPGNIRELKNIIEHALIKSGGSIIQPEHLHFIEVIPPVAETRRSRTPNSGEFGYIRGRSKPEVSATSATMDIEELEALVIERAQPRNAEEDGQNGSSLTTDEEKILAYIREHGSITNSKCRDLLSVSYNRASYLLRKMHQYGLLVREGEQRWARYRLS